MIELIPIYQEKEDRSMRFQRRCLAAALLALGAVSLGAPPIHATSSPPMNVADLVRHSAAIVVGTVSNVTQFANAGQVPYTRIQVKVSETVRGHRAPDETLTFNQFGLQSPLPAADGRVFVGAYAGMPTYRTGERVVLFLGPVSSIGLRTTAGLQQGKFVAGAAGLLNEVNNSGLFRNLSFAGKTLSDREQAMVESNQGAVVTETFLGLVRRAVSERWWDVAQTPVPGGPKGGVAGRQAPTSVAPAEVTP